MPFEKGNQYRFKPGVSGNPDGRPAGRTLEEEIRSIFDETVDAPDGKKITKLEVMSRVIVDKAIRDRDIKTISMIAKRLWPEEQRVSLSGDLNVSGEIEEAARRLDGIIARHRERTDTDGSGEREPVH